MRCFIGIDLKEEIVEKVRDAQKELVSPFLRSTPIEMVHITLKFLGEISDEKVKRVGEELGKIETKTFPVTFKGVGAFPSREYMRVVWIGCEGEGLERLADEIDGRLAPLGFRKEEFAGHLTIARVSGKVDICGFFEKYENVEFGSMGVDSFVLKKSTLTPKGAIHEPIRVFPLV
jgi:2'-5' RNA ligase